MLELVALAGDLICQAGAEIAGHSFRGIGLDDALQVGEYKDGEGGANELNNDVVEFRQDITEAGFDRLCILVMSSKGVDSGGDDLWYYQAYAIGDKGQ